MKKKIVSILLACCMTFGGSISAEEAAQTLGEKMQLYLSE